MKSKTRKSEIKKEGKNFKQLHTGKLRVGGKENSQA